MIGFNKDGLLMSTFGGENKAYWDDFQTWFVRELGYGGWIEFGENESTLYREDRSVHSRFPVEPKHGEIGRFDISKIAAAMSAKMDEMIAKELK